MHQVSPQKQVSGEEEEMKKKLKTSIVRFKVFEPSVDKKIPLIGLVEIPAESGMYHYPKIIAGSTHLFLETPFAIRADDLHFCSMEEVFHLIRGVYLTDPPTGDRDAEADITLDAYFKVLGYRVSREEALGFNCQ